MTELCRKAASEGKDSVMFISSELGITNRMEIETFAEKHELVLKVLYRDKYEKYCLVKLSW